MMDLGTTKFGTTAVAACTVASIASAVDLPRVDASVSLFFGTVPTPGGIGVLAAGGLIVTRRRRGHARTGGAS